MRWLCQKMLAADGIIFGTPVYIYSMTGQAKVIMARTSYLRLANKAGGVVVVAGSLGSNGLSSALHTWLLLDGNWQELEALWLMPVAPVELPACTQELLAPGSRQGRGWIA